MRSCGRDAPVWQFSGGLLMLRGSGDKCIAARAPPSSPRLHAVVVHSIVRLSGRSASAPAPCRCRWRQRGTSWTITPQRPCHWRYGAASRAGTTSSTTRRAHTDWRGPTRRRSLGTLRTRSIAFLCCALYDPLPQAHRTPVDRGGMRMAAAACACAWHCVRALDANAQSSFRTLARVPAGRRVANPRTRPCRQ